MIDVTYVLLIKHYSPKHNPMSVVQKELLKCIFLYRKVQMLALTNNKFYCNVTDIYMSVSVGTI